MQQIDDIMIQMVQNNGMGTDPKISIGFPEVLQYESVYRLRVDAEIERPFLRELLALMEKYNNE